MMCAEYDYDMNIAVQREESYEDGFVAGEKRGELLGKARSVIELLKNNGVVTEELASEIMEQEDETVLNMWLKIAATVSTVDEFERKFKG